MLKDRLGSLENQVTGRIEMALHGLSSVIALFHWLAFGTAS